MNKLINLAKNNGFQYDKKREIAFGSTDGYYIILKELKAKKQILMKMNLKNSTEKGVDINQFFYQIEQENSFVETATYNDNECLVVITGSKNKITDNLNVVTKKIISFCILNKLQNACKLCGQNNALNIYGVGESAYVLCHNCYSTSKIDIEENLSKTNFLMGILGAFLGSLIGVALWIFIYQLGYIAGIAGAAMIIFSFKGFKMFGKELTLSGAICCIIISFIMIPISVYICWSMELMTYIGEGITFSECVSSLFYIMQDNSEVFRGMVGEMLMGFLLYFVASVSIILSTIKSTKIKHKTEVLINK